MMMRIRNLTSARSSCQQGGKTRFGVFGNICIIPNILAEAVLLHAPALSLASGQIQTVRVDRRCSGEGVSAEVVRVRTLPCPRCDVWYILSLLLGPGWTRALLPDKA